jgi:hypothetical protein
MKKFVILFLCLFLALTIVSCKDDKSFDDSISVIFFTGDKAGEPGYAERVDTLFNMHEGDLVPKPDDPSYPGFAFMGWFKDKSHTIPWDFDVDTVPAYSTILYAYFDAGLFNIFYDLQGGYFKNPDIVPTSYYVGKRKTLPDSGNIKREGYAFKGLSLTPGEYSASIVTVSQVEPTMAEDLYLFAHWIPLSITITFVSFNPETGARTNPGGITMLYGSLMALPILEDTVNYTFFGWCQSPTNFSIETGTYYRNGEPLKTTNNRQLYAIWKHRTTGELCHKPI